MKNRERKTILDPTENFYENNAHEIEMEEAPTTTEVSTNKITQSRINLGTLILLTIMFLFLIVMSSLLLNYYLAMNKDMSHLKNYENVILKDGLTDLKNRTDNQQQIVLEGVEKIRKDLDNVKQHFLQDIKAINKTIDNQQQVLEGVNNGLENAKQHLLHDTKAINKTIDDVKQYFLQDINSIKKTIETFNKPCPSGWKTIGSACYYFSVDDLSWDNAKNECIRHWSSLVLLNTKEETDALKSMLEKARYWIGLRRETSENWQWLDGSLMSFSNWQKGEPNNAGNNERCVESKYGYWNDENCTTTLKYVCKK